MSSYGCDQVFETIIKPLDPWEAQPRVIFLAISKDALF
jgi:hypothetical protein